MFHRCFALTDDLEEVVRENLRLRHDLMVEVAKASMPVPFGHKVRQWWSARFGRSDDQPLGTVHVFWSRSISSHTMPISLNFSALG